MIRLESRVEKEKEKERDDLIQRHDQSLQTESWIEHPIQTQTQQVHIQYLCD